MLRTRHRLSSLFISFDARNQAFQFRSNMHHREGGDFIRRAGNDFASLTNIFVSTFESLRSWGSFNLETKLVNWFFFSFFLLIFCDNRGKKRVEYYFYARQPISTFNYPNKMNEDFLNPEHRFPFRWNNVWAELFRN